MLLDKESAAAAMLEKSGVACGPLLDALSTRLNKGEGTQKLEAGKRATASKSLRDLIEKSFEKMSARGAERAEAVDFLLAAAEFGETGLKSDLRQAGATAATLDKASASRAATGEALGEPKSSGAAASKAGSKMLEKFSRDLTAAAAAGELMPVVGRDEEVRRVIQTLLRKSKNNPVLVGDPGTGKTAIVKVSRSVSPLVMFLSR